MIFTERTITVVNDSATINKPLILYRGDKNIELKITIVESQFKFRSTGASNVIETSNASYAQLVINTPYNSPIFSEVTATENGTVIFVISAAMIDEVREVGIYDIQIRLLDDNKQSRASIPPVSNAIEIREPMAIEDGSAVDSNAVNVAKVNRALATTSAPLKAFDSQGNYIKNNWGDGDPITDAALNKIEVGIDGVNKKIGNVNSQIKNINNNIQNIGNPTDEQVKNAINEAIANGDIIGGGLTSTAQTLLISILRNAVFTSNQSENITLLQSELAKDNSESGGSETTRYTITNTLNNATTSNSAVLVDANSSYTAIIRENDGYTLDAITVTMGGVDITSSVVSGETINISAVTGNVVITVTTTESGSSSGGGMVTDGLVNYFDFRTAAYDNNGAGGSTIISATQGNGSLYCWANNTISTQDEYGITQANTRGWIYSATGGTTETKITGSFTIACYGYTNSDTQFFGTWGRYTNLSPNIKLQPTYNTSSSTVSVTAEQYATSDLPNGSGFRSYMVTADADTGIAKIYVGGVLAKTYTGSDYSDFVSWCVDAVGVTQASAKLTACAVYNRPFTDIEAVDMHDFFTTMEVK